jgi:hypothetical protein
VRSAPPGCSSAARQSPPFTCARQPRPLENAIGGARTMVYAASQVCAADMISGPRESSLGARAPQAAPHRRKLVARERRGLQQCGRGRASPFLRALNTRHPVRVFQTRVALARVSGTPRPRPCFTWAPAARGPEGSRQRWRRASEPPLTRRPPAAQRSAGRVALRRLDAGLQKAARKRLRMLS